MNEKFVSSESQLFTKRVPPSRDLKKLFNSDENGIFFKNTESQTISHLFLQNYGKRTN